MKKIEAFLLAVILLLGFSVRLYRVDRPIMGWHSWRQSDTSAVSRNFVKQGFDILHPRFDDLSKTQNTFDNPHGYRFVELPLYNVGQAGLYKLFGWLTLEEWGRLVTIIASSFSTLLLYLIGRRYVGFLAGLSSAFFFAFVPFSVFYGRTILPDESMVSASLFSIYFFSLWIDNKKILFYLLSLLFASCALLLKPFAIFFAIPLFVIAWQSYGFKLFKNWRLALFAIVSIAPLIWWRTWMLKYPEGIPDDTFLYNSNHIRFTGAFFYWIFGDRIARLILGFWGLPIIFVGIIAKLRTNKELIIYAFLVSSLLYVTIFAGGNVQHDYYQIFIIPSLALLFGRGIQTLLSSHETEKIVAISTIIVSVILMLAFGWYFIKDYYNIYRIDIIDAAKTVDKLTPKDAKIIAPYGGDTVLLYNSNRQGWPVVDRPVEDLIKAGATYMIFMNPSPPELNFKNQYKIVTQTNHYILYDLTHPLK